MSAAWNKNNGLFLTRLIAAAVFVASCSLCGCSTVLAMRDSESRHEVYGGTKVDVVLIQGGGDGNMRAFGLLDIAFSFVADTLVLPYTLFSKKPEHQINTTEGCAGSVCR